jgi:starch-binding outer membrane protein, SusD/RagB family
MMKNIKFILLMLLAIATSCESALEEKAYSSFTTGKTFESIEGAQMAVNGIYGPLVGEVPGWGYWKIAFMEVAMGTDELYVNPDWDMPNANYRTTSTNDRLEDIYVDMYKGIGRANMCINRIPDMSDGTEAQRNALIAEARTLRAIYYFDAVNFFETPPLVTAETAGFSDEIYVSNSTPKAIFSQIVEDLKFAVENGAEPSNKGRANKYTAAALLAKVYMFMGSEYWLPLVFDDPSDPVIEGTSVYQLAVDMAEFVINGPYSLSPASTADDYGEIFIRSTQDNNPGVILTLNFNEARLPTKYGQWLAPNFWEMPSDASGGVAKDPRDDRFVYHSEQGWPAPVSQMAISFHDNDLRFGWSIIPGFFNKDYTFRPMPCHNWRCSKYRAEKGFSWGTDLAIPYIRLADVYLIKAEALNEMSSTPPADAYEAINAVRRRAKVPEIDAGYLTASNPHSDVDMLWGMQGGQAYMDDMTNAVYPGRHVYYTNTLIPLPELKDKFRAAVQTERLWELCFERQRWIDCKRWRRLEDILGGSDPKLKQAINATFYDDYVNDPIPKAFYKSIDNLQNPPGITPELNGYGHYQGQGGDGFVMTFNKDVHYKYPIPLSAINANPELKQNYGY